jgi:lipoyl-dependent peroxiredoxin subunit D
MEHIEKIREQLPDVARDIKINLDNVLGPGTLNASQVWGVALASAYAARNPVLVEAIAAQARAASIDDGVIDDAKAAAVLMGMNNVFYRFRHVIGKEDYAQRPARLRMQRLNQVASNKADFELFCLAVSAINDCEACVRAHENTVVDHGLSVDQVHDAVRIAATVHAAAIALEIGS